MDAEKLRDCGVGTVFGGLGLIVTHSDALLEFRSKQIFSRVLPILSEHKRTKCPMDLPRSLGSAFAQLADQSSLDGLFALAQPTFPILPGCPDVRVLDLV